MNTPFIEQRLALFVKSAEMIPFHPSNVLPNSLKVALTIVTVTLYSLYRSL